MMIISLKSISEYLGDIFFPPREDELVLRKLSKTKVKLFLASSTLEHQVTALSSFQNPTIRALIHEAKFHYNKKAFALLAELVPQYPDEQHIYIPIPLSSKRYQERGYNQVHEILKNVPNIKIDTKTLYRKLHTTPQTSLSRSERLTNMNGAFAVKESRKGLLEGKHVIIIDDVTTTGATLKAAKEALLPYSPSSITCIAIAH